MNSLLQKTNVLERPAPLTERIYKEIKEKIQRAELKPGQPIRESDLCEYFSVSRTPAREALQRLQHEGLLEAQGLRGLIVATLTRKDVEEIYQLRLILEVGAIILTCDQQHSATDNLEHQAIEASIAAASRAMSENNAEKFIDANRDFRNAWLNLVPNERLVRAVKLYAGHVRALQAATLTSNRRQKEVLQGMSEIYQSIKNANSCMGEVAMKKYLETAHKAMLEQVEFYEITSSKSI